MTTTSTVHANGKATYPSGFSDWPVEKRNRYFADEARRHREAETSRGKAARPLSANFTPTTISSRDLMAKEFEPVRYIVPGYVAEGATILAGRPKLGKSWLALEMALAVATGGTCLGGIECEKGDVLYLALEDNQRRLQSRLDRLLPGGDPGHDNLHLSTAWPRASEGGLGHLRKWLDAHPAARLVVVDILTMFRDARDGKATPYEADYQSIKGLQELAAAYGVAVLIVTHTRKGAGADGDAFDKVSGTLGLSGAADSTLVIDRDSQGITLYGRGRDIEEIETAIHFDRDTCRWSALGKAADVRRTDERSQILEVLKESDEPMTPTDLAGALGVPVNNMKQMLFKMAKAGEVTKVKRGLYIHPDNHDNQITNDASGGDDE